MGANPFLVNFCEIAIIRTHLMFVRLKIQKIPTRVLPLTFNELKGGSIKKLKNPIAIIRSPHIDKRSWEHFRFTSHKTVMSLATAKQYHLAIKIAKILESSFSILRITLAVGKTLRFKTTF